MLSCLIFDSTYYYTSRSIEDSKIRKIFIADIFQIIMGIEEEYDIELDNESVEQIQTVGDAVEAIRTIK